MIIELRWVSTQRSRHAIHSPGFPSVLPLVNFRVMVHPPHRSCGVEDSTPQLALTSGKERAQRGVEDLVKFVAVALNIALETVRSKGESAPFREAKFSSSPMLRRQFMRLQDKCVWKFVWRNGAAP